MLTYNLLTQSFFNHLFTFLFSPQQGSARCHATELTRTILFLSKPCVATHLVLDACNTFEKIKLKVSNVNNQISDSPG
jgi:hypothetical protein